MLYDAAWHDRIACVLSGALRLWGATGTVVRDPDRAGGFLVSAHAATQMRIVHSAARGWMIFRGELPLGGYAGLPGLLRCLREELAPHAAPGRLVIGAQSLL